MVLRGRKLNPTMVFKDRACGKGSGSYKVIRLESYDWILVTFKNGTETWHIDIKLHLPFLLPYDMLRLCYQNRCQCCALQPLKMCLKYISFLYKGSLSQLFCHGNKKLINRAIIKLINDLQCQEPAEHMYWGRRGKVRPGALTLDLYPNLALGLSLLIHNTEILHVKIE